MSAPVVNHQITRRLFAGADGSLLLMPAVIVSVAVSCVAIGYLVADTIRAEREVAVSEARLQEQARLSRMAQQQISDAWRRGHAAGQASTGVFRRIPNAAKEI